MCTGFDDSKIVILIWKTKNVQINQKIRRCQMQAFLAENLAWTLEELTETWNVGKSTVSDCLHAMRKI